MSSAPPARLAKWSLVATVALLAGALLVTAWTTYAAVTDASATLIRGQADGLEHALRWQLASPDGPPTPEQLREVLEEERAAGLRYLAVIERGGELVAEAGTPSPFARRPGRDPEPGEPGELASLESRTRTVFRLPSRRGGFREGHGRPTLVVAEFEPVQAQALRATAKRTFGVGAVAALALIAVSVTLVRRALEKEAQERQREHERRLATVGEMSATLAHEIKNPLASLKGNAQLLAQTLEPNTKPRQKAERVVDEAMRLEALTNGLLEYVRTGTLQRQSAAPGQLLREAAAQVGGEIAVEDGRAPAQWPLDPERMRQVLVNLLQNAVQAGAPVRACAALAEGALVFEVEDSGPGVPPEDRERVFEPFFTRKTQGTGLGLAVVKRVVEQHGGTIIVQSAERGGARFRIVLPGG